MSTARPARRQYSYPLSLAVVTALLVTATGGWISWWSYRSGRDNAKSSAGQLFDQVAREMAEASGSFLDRAPPAAETVSGLALLDRPGVGSDDIARRLTAILVANPTFSWVTESDHLGQFNGAYRPAEGGMRVNQSHIADGKTVLDEHEVGSDGAWTPGKHEDDSKYDPRERPFYKLGVAAKRGVWTPPYAFAMPRKADLSPGDRVPGITYARPIVTPDGAVTGMVTVDFDLKHLSELVARLDVSEHGRAVILAEDDTVIAHPTESLVAPGADGALVKAQQLNDPALRALVAGGTARDDFDVAGTPYLARDEIMPLPGGGVGSTWRVLVYAPTSDFTGALIARVVSALMVSLVGVVLAILVAWLLARRVSGPLTNLAKQMAEVGEFRLDEQPAPWSMFREIAMMNDALARMKGGLRSFGQYVPRDLVRAVLASGQEATLRGEVRQLTVYFSDLAGFTTMSEKKKPDELVEFLGEYLDDMTTIIAGEKGTVDKYLGDGIMAFWGAPQPLADHAARACAAALRCQKRLDEYAARGTPLLTRIGVATGDVLVGNIGSHERMNYTVMGDTANLASRLEGLNKQFGTSLMISEGTYEAAKASIIARPLDVVAVKGKSQGVRVYELLALASDKNDAAVALAADATAALDAYLARDFQAAITACDRILARTPDDKPARTLRDRAAGLVAAPPPMEWSGIFVATEK
jgi:adenylate cyclase